MAATSISSRLIVITGPSGVGKGSLVKELLRKHPEIWLSVSATTRDPRYGEVDGKDYVRGELWHQIIAQLPRDWGK